MTPSIYFLTSLLATVFCVIVLYPCAQKIGLLDKPNHRKLHQKPIPLIGGVAIYLGILFTLLINNIQLFHQAAFVSAVSLLVFVGLVDDFKGLGVKIRIFAQIAAVLIMTEFANIKITDLGDLLGTGNIELGALSTAFTVFAVVGGINAFNMIDGIDGLSGSLALVSITTIAVLAWFSHNWPIYYYCVILIASILAFLLFNLRIVGRKRASIFLGDTGSTLLGFSVCWLSIYASQGEDRIIAPTNVLWLMAIPLFDSISVMCRRMNKGLSPFAPDREHLHHILSTLGYKVNQELIMIVIFAVTLSVASNLSSLFLELSESVLFLSFLCLFAYYYWGINNIWNALGTIEQNGSLNKTNESRIKYLTTIKIHKLE